MIKIKKLHQLFCIILISNLPFHEFFSNQLITFELTDQSGNVFAVVEKEDDKPWIYVQWLGTLHVEELKRVMTRYVGFLTQVKCPYVLSDRRKSQGNLFDLGRFIENKWASLAVDAGLRCVANVSGPESTASFTIQDLQSRMLGFEFRSFDLIEDAEEWLMEKATQAQH